MSKPSNSVVAGLHEPGVRWHTLEATDVLKLLTASEQGLRIDEAHSRLEKFGPNALPKKGAPSVAEVFLRQFKSPLIYILLAAGVVSVVIGEFTDAMFIFAVVLLNAVIGTVQEYKSEKSAAALEEMLRTRVTVRRDGQEREIDAEEVVPGDIVLLESGLRVPADIRLLKKHSLAVDESILTGESETVDKQTEPLDKEVQNPADQINMAFAGTTVMAGRGEGVVVHTGLRTELGKISEAVSAADTTPPPLVVRMNRFVRWLSYIFLGAVLVFAIVSGLQGTPWAEVFFLAVALAVSAIPEGLPVAITVALTVGLIRMAHRQVIIRKLTAVEGLGSCTCIASDKTGTLTVNKQTARILSLPEESGFTRYSVSGEGYSDEGEILRLDGSRVSEHDRSRIVEMTRAAVLANEGRLVRENSEWRGEGDPIDIGFLALAYKAGEPPSHTRSIFRITHHIPYESERKLAGAFYENGSAGSIAAAKGAVEAILARCDSIAHVKEAIPLAMESIEKEAEHLAQEGYRVLAVATGGGAAPKKPAETLSEEDFPPLKLLGLVGFVDPLRPEAKAAVQECGRAGVRVAMITGDHPQTALALGKELGLAESRDDLISGAELDRLEHEHEPLAQKIKRTSVFARINPLQKVQIVSAFVDQGHFVAVTGDGVNDAPALRRAHIGVAMGSGTDVAKQTGSIIITDDNFASIVAGIEEGRRAYQNIRKVIYLLVATGAAEVILFLLALVAAIPLPLVAVQLLWLNVVTNGIQHVALAFERGEPGLMKQPPRNPNEPIFNRLMTQETIIMSTVIALVTFAVWFWLHTQGLSEREDRNLILLLMVLFENFHALNCRSETASVFQVPMRNNLLLMIAIPGALGLHVLTLYLPFMQNVLGTEPVSILTFVVLFACASTVLMASEVFKYFKRRSERIR